MKVSNYCRIVLISFSLCCFLYLLFNFYPLGFCFYIHDHHCSIFQIFFLFLDSGLDFLLISPVYVVLNCSQYSVNELHYSRWCPFSILSVSSFYAIYWKFFDMLYVMYVFLCVALILNICLLCCGYGIAFSFHSIVYYRHLKLDVVLHCFDLVNYNFHCSMLLCDSNFEMRLFSVLWWLN